MHTSVVGQIITSRAGGAYCSAGVNAAVGDGRSWRHTSVSAQIITVSAGSADSITAEDLAVGYRCGLGANSVVGVVAGFAKTASGSGGGGDAVSIGVVLAIRRKRAARCDGVVVVEQIRKITVHVVEGWDSE